MQEKSSFLGEVCLGLSGPLANYSCVSASVLNKLAEFYLIQTDTEQKKTNLGN